MAAKDQQLEHNIRSIGKSVLVIGGFYAFLTIFVLIVVAFDGIAQQDSRALFYGTILTVVLSLFWILMGVKIRRSAKKPKEALKPIGIVAVVSVAYFILNIFETILAGANLGIVITTIFTLYITWSYYDTKSRIDGNKK